MATIAEQLTSLANTKTAIKDAIIARGVSVSDSDTFRSYASKIGEIGETVEKTKFGASVDTFIGDVVDGVLQAPTAQTELNFAGVTEIGKDALKSRFQGLNIAKIDAGSVQTIGVSGLLDAFRNSSVGSIVFSSVRTIGASGMEYALYSEAKLNYFTTADFRLLQTVGRNGMNHTFYQHYQLENINFSALHTIDASAFKSTFEGDTHLTSAYFPSLINAHKDGFGDMNVYAIFYSCSALTEIHFRADAQAVIEAMTCYSNKFGASNATIYFDLIGTITVDGVAYSRAEINSVYEGDTKTFVAWKDESDNFVYTDATAEPAVGTVVYSDQGTTQVGTVSEVA